MKLLFRAVAATGLGLLLFSQSATASEPTPDLSLAKEVDSYLQEAQSGSAPNSVAWSVDKGIKWKSADGNFKGQFGGRLMLDWKWISADQDSVSSPGTAGTSPIGFADSEFSGDGVFPRRIRLFISGTVYKNVGFKIQVDFAGGPDSAPDPKDVWFSLKKIFLSGTVKMGHFKEPFGLEELTSSKYISFIERSIVTNAFAPSRNVGIGFFHVFTEDKRIAVQYGLFRETDDDLSQMENGGYNFTIRVAGWFLEDEETNQVLHVGFSFSYRDPSGEDQRNRARGPVGSGDRLFNTGTYDADEVTLFAFELAFMWQSLHFAAEYMMSSSSAPTGGEDFDFSGFYVEIGYWVTGEAKNYSKKPAPA